MPASEARSGRTATRSPFKALRPLARELRCADADDPDDPDREDHDHAATDPIERARGEAESAIQRARGEAEANRLRQASITSQLIEWRRLDNDRARIDRWNGELPRMIISGKPSMFMNLPNEMRDDK